MMHDSNSKIFVILALTVLCIGGIGALSLVSDGSSADSPNYELQTGVYYNITVKSTSGLYLDFDGPSSIPGMTLHVDFESGIIPTYDKRYLRMTGTPTVAGNYNVPYKTWNSLGATSYDQATVLVYEVVEYFDITYSAGIGTVKGVNTFTENLAKGSYASLPSAVYSSGAYSFKGWAISPSSTTTVSSYVVTSNATLYAVWTQNKVSISGDSNLTAVQNNAFSQSYTTSPTGASLSISSYGGLTGQVTLSGKSLLGNITADPGTYYVTLSATSSGYLSGSLSVKITVPVVIVPPIEYTQAVDKVWSYEPVTNPSNASIAIKTVKFNNTVITNSGLTVQGRTIIGTLSNVGTYSIEFTASATGYTSVSKTVLVYTYVPDPSPPPSVSGLTATERVGEPRTFDFIATGIANAVLITWYVDDVEFASSHNTAVYEFPSAGVYTVKVAILGADGSTAVKSIQIVNDQPYNRDMAWSGVEYGYVKLFTGSAPSVNVSGPFTSSVIDVDGKNYVFVKGTPSSSDVGNTYSVSVGSDSWTIKVYSKEIEAPISDFTYSLSDDFVLSVNFKGSYASKVLWDYGDGVLTSAISHSYSDWGYYTVRCIAINNISERICSQLIEVAIPDEITISFLNLSDYYGIVNKPVVISVTGLADSDVLSISGTAAQFLKVDGFVISGKVSEVGVYGLSLTATHSDNSVTSHSIVMYIKEGDNPDPDPDPIKINSYYIWIIVVILLALAVLYFLWGRY